MTATMTRYVYSLVQATTPAQDRLTVGLIIGRDGEPFALHRATLRNRAIQALGMDMATVQQFLDVVAQQAAHLRSEQELVEFATWHFRSMLQPTMPWPTVGTDPAEIAASILNSLGLS